MTCNGHCCARCAEYEIMQVRLDTALGERAVAKRESFLAAQQSAEKIGALQACLDAAFEEAGAAERASYLARLERDHARQQEKELAAEVASLSRSLPETASERPEVARLREDVEVYRRAVRRAVCERNDLRSELAKARERIVELDDPRARLFEASDISAANEDRLSRLLTEAHEKIDELDGRRARVQKALEASSADVDRLSRSLAEAGLEIAGLRRANARLEGELAGAAIDMAAFQRETRETRDQS